MAKEFDVVIGHALAQNRISPAGITGLRRWFDTAHRLMASYRPGHHDPQKFEEQVLERSLAELHRQAGQPVSGE